jgi:hypothetical protein
LAGFEPANFASCGKHTNNYTTKATSGSVARESVNYKQSLFISLSSRHEDEKDIGGVTPHTYTSALHGYNYLDASAD